MWWIRTNKKLMHPMWCIWYNFLCTTKSIDSNWSFYLKFLFSGLSCRFMYSICILYIYITNIIKYVCGKWMLGSVKNFFNIYGNFCVIFPSDLLMWWIILIDALIMNILHSWNISQWVIWHNYLNLVLNSVTTTLFRIFI